MLADSLSDRSEDYELNRRREQSSQLDDIRRQQRRVDERHIDDSRRVEGKVSRTDRRIHGDLDEIARNHIFNRDERRREQNTRRVDANFDRSERLNIGDAMAVNVRRELMNEFNENYVRDINQRDEQVSRREQFRERNRNGDDDRRSEDRDETRMQLSSRRGIEHEQNQLADVRRSDTIDTETRFDPKSERRNSLEREVRRQSPKGTDSLLRRRINERIERQTTDRRLHQRTDIRKNRAEEERMDRRIRNTELEFERSVENRRDAHRMKENERSERESRTSRRGVPASADAHRFGDDRLSDSRHMAPTPIQTQTNVSATLAWQMAQALLIGVLIMKIVRKNDTLKLKR